MIRRTNVWRDRVWLWLLPLSLVLFGGAALVLHQTSFSGRARLGSAFLESRSNELKQLRRHRLDVMESLAQIESNQRNVAEFYASRLATESSRLTAVIAEVKDLARRAGLEPKSISYPSQAVADFDLSIRYMVFSVTGSYSQLRRLINFLELSDMFLVLNEISLGGHGNGKDLRISLRLSTVFSSKQLEAGLADRMQVQG